MSSTETKGGGFTAAEKAAMRERAKEARAAERGAIKRADGEAAIREKLAELPADERTIGERIHTIVTERAPELMPRTWYGMPAYTADDKVVCYFKSAEKFGTRYAQFGFEEKAALDDGELWPVVFAVTEMTATVEARIAALVEQAVRAT